MWIVSCKLNSILNSQKMMKKREKEIPCSRNDHKKKFAGGIVLRGEKLP